MPTQRACGSDLTHLYLIHDVTVSVRLGQAAFCGMRTCRASLLCIPSSAGPHVAPAAAKHASTGPHDKPCPSCACLDAAAQTCSLLLVCVQGDERGPVRACILGLRDAWAATVAIAAVVWCKRVRAHQQSLLLQHCYYTADLPVRCQLHRTATKGKQHLPSTKLVSSGAHVAGSAHSVHGFRCAAMTVVCRLAEPGTCAA